MVDDYVAFMLLGLLAIFLARTVFFYKKGVRVVVLALGESRLQAIVEKNVISRVITARNTKSI